MLQVKLWSIQDASSSEQKGDGGLAGLVLKDPPHSNEHNKVQCKDICAENVLARFATSHLAQWLICLEGDGPQRLLHLHTTFGDVAIRTNVHVYNVYLTWVFSRLCLAQRSESIQDHVERPLGNVVNEIIIHTCCDLYSSKMFTLLQNTCKKNTLTTIGPFTLSSIKSRRAGCLWLPKHLLESSGKSTHAHWRSLFTLCFATYVGFWPQIFFRSSCFLAITSHLQMQAGSNWKHQMAESRHLQEICNSRGLRQIWDLLKKWFSRPGQSNRICNEVEQLSKVAKQWPKRMDWVIFLNDSWKKWNGNRLLKLRGI